MELKPKELIMLKLVCREKTNQEMADHFGYSLRQTEKIKQSLYKKTKAKSNLGLFKWALKKGHCSFKF